MSWLCSFGLSLVLVATMAAWSAPTHAAGSQVALVIGNGTYSSLPVLAACPLSSHAVSAALRRLGFDVVESEDTSSGGLDAAISDFAGRLTAGSAAVVYVCGYAAAFNSRVFLLPVSASITRPTDILTQGLLARTLIDVLARGNTDAALLALDVTPAPGGPPQLGLDKSRPGTLPAGAALIVAEETKPAANPTPLANALVSGLAGPQVLTNTLLAGLQQQLEAAKPGVTVAALQPAVRPGYLARGSAAARAAARLCRPGRLPRQLRRQTSAPVPQAPGPVAAVTKPMPADSDMTEAQRRDVQIALAKLGYYDGRLDGIFGPDTRAAIRRYQHELHADMTGMLTADQATRLVNQDR